MAAKRIGILTGGGDCPGLNAVIRAVAKTARFTYDLEVVGIMDGFKGLIEGRSIILDDYTASGILSRGGTILGSSNKANPFKWYPEGEDEPIDVSEQAAEYYHSLDLDGLVVVGGDGTLELANNMMEKGLKVVGVPKTIDNDVAETLATVGFDSAVNTASWAIDKIQSTAQSHHRVMVVEVMGRYVGWLALISGIASGGDIILIPEIPYSVEEVARKVRERSAVGKRFSVVVIAEGAHSAGGELVVQRTVKHSHEKIRLGGVGLQLANELEDLTGQESRATILGHIQRGGNTSSYDRILGTRFGVKAVDCLVAGELGVMVAKTAQGIGTVPITKIAGITRKVPADHEMVHAARSIGVSFGVGE